MRLSDELLEEVASSLFELRCPPGALGEIFVTIVTRLKAKQTLRKPLIHYVAKTYRGELRQFHRRERRTRLVQGDVE